MNKKILDDQTYVRTARTLSGPVLAGFEKEHRQRGGAVPAQAPKAEHRTASLSERFREIFGQWGVL
jgi:hypothetical protein